MSTETTTFASQFTIQQPERARSRVSEDFPMYEFAKGWSIGVQPLEIDFLNGSSDVRQCFAVFLRDPKGELFKYRIAEGPLRYPGEGGIYSEAGEEFTHLSELTHAVDRVRGTENDAQMRRVYFPRVLADTLLPLEDTSHIQNRRKSVESALISGMSGVRKQRVLSWLQNGESTIYSPEERKIISIYLILQAIHRRNEVREFGFLHNHPNLSNYHVNGSADVQLLDFTLMTHRNEIGSYDIDDVYQFFKKGSFAKYFPYIGVPFLTRLRLYINENENKKTVKVNKRSFQILERKLYRLLRKYHMSEDQVKNTLLSDELFEQFMLEQTLAKTSFGIPTSEELIQGVTEMKRAIADSPTIVLRSNLQDR